MAASADSIPSQVDHKMALDMLPADVFYYMLNYLSIDDRINARSVFKMFDFCFTAMCNVTRRRKSLGVNLINVSSLLPGRDHLATRKLISDYYLLDRWECSDLNHLPLDTFSTNQALMNLCAKCGHLQLLCVLKNCPLIESLDLRGVTLTVALIEGIVRYCPNICCFKLNFSSFENVEALNLFVTSLCPKLKHLSCDNLFFHREHDGVVKIFSNAVNLQQAEICLFPNDNFIPNDFRSIATNVMKFISLRFCKIKRRELVSAPHFFLEALRDSNAKNIEYFKIKSNYDYIANYCLFDELKKFNCLRAVNLGFMNYFKTENRDFQVSHCWPYLSSFTIDLYNLAGSNKLLSLYLNGSFSDNLRSLRISDCHLFKRTLKDIAKKCSRLSSLQLLDITFKDIGNIFDTFSLFTNLSSLHIEYTIKYCPQYRSQLAEVFKFPEDKIEHVVNFIESHRSLESVYFIEWPGLQLDHIRRLNRVARERNVYTYIQEYTEN